LLFSKPFALLIFRVADCLDKRGPRGIDTISQIITLIIRVAINHIGNLKSISFGKPKKYRTAVEHIDIIV
jgi:hypothetical protein